MKPNLRNLVSVPLRSNPFRWAAAVVAGLISASTQAQPLTVGAVNTANREDVRTLFNSVYLPGEGPVALEWTGNMTACNPGTIAQSVRDRAQQRVNFYRALAGVPGEVTFTVTNNALAQAGAFVNSVNRATSHTVPTTWTCYSEQGARGAGSNLIGNSNNQGLGPKAIDTWIDDSSFNNEAVGHRRHILNPYQLTMGYGDVPATGGGVAPNGYPSTAALYVFGDRYPQRPAPRDEFVAWPPPGFFPYQLYSPRWNFSLAGGNFDNTTVTLSLDGMNLPLTIQYRNSGIGAETITFIRTDEVNRVIRLSPPAADQIYTVNVNNVVVNGTPRNFTYRVTLFDPATPGAGYAPMVITGPDRPPLNQATTYNFTPGAAANGYQWRASKLAPLALTDGAENGLANFDPVVTTYDPVTTTIKASGNAGFRLRRTGNVSEQQSLTFKRSLLANANSQITFKSRLLRTLSYTSAVQVSLDGGVSWRTVFGQPASEAEETVFTDKVVSLAAYADRQIQVRFALVVSAGQAFAGGDEPAWYFDDITFVNLQELAGAPVINNVASTSFGFNPTEAADFALDVRPQVFGQYFGEWGQVRRVSTITVTPAAPTITTQPQGQNVVAGATVTLTVTAQGTAPLAYVWKLNGTDLADGGGIAGSRTPTLTVQNVQAAQAGSYTVQISNGLGNVTSTPAVVVLSEAPSLASALDTTGLTWTTAGNANWAVQTAVTHDNVDAARSGQIADSQESRLETTINGPATVAFWWRVESEQNYDFLRVDLDGTQQFRISGTVNWEQKTVAVPAGTHTLRWVYAKDGSTAAGADAGWVDQVETRQAQPPPSLADALDTTNVAWSASGNVPWFSQLTTTHDGADAAQSGPIADGQSSRVEATILGPANLSFWWKVDSEPNYDFLSFELDNAPLPAVTPISGSVDWQQKTVPIPAGTHVIRWIYAKDGSANNGADAGWLDQVVLTKLTPGEGTEPGPKLEFTASGSKLRITWPEVAQGFKLQIANSLAAGDWTDVPENDISKEEGEFYVIVNTAAGTKFYRLVEP